MNEIVLELSDGQRARIRSLQGDLLRLDAERPLPPGTRVEGRLEDMTLRGKVTAAARGPDGGAQLTVKLMDTTRQARDRIARRLLALLPE